jgi:uncharacterized GH25 family protein
MRYPVCTRERKTLTWLLSLLLVLWWVASGDAHTLWIQSEEYVVSPGRTSVMFMDYGDFLPVGDMLDTSRVKGFTVHEPDGEKVETRFPDSQKGYMATPITYTKEGSYRLTSEIVPGYYTVYKREGDDHEHHYGGRVDTIKDKVTEVLKSVFFEGYTKCIVTAAKQNGVAGEPVGQRMEIILHKDPTEYRTGDMVEFTVLWEGKRLRQEGFFCAMPQGESPYINDYKYYRIPLDDGRGSFRITRPAIWYLKADLRVKAPDDMVPKCETLTYKASITFQVDVEGGRGRW